ncbi:Rrf2 family transcriptional regulator [Pseudoxanthomonas sp. SGD-10]|nr:Rrf2 family transcriptional regulator [Pseudoxanthomonas sp. SGD-10]
MLLSKTCEYAVRATIFIAHKSMEYKKVSIPEISMAINSPQHFTGKILQTLVREKVVSSSKGPNGGFFIENSREVCVADVVKAIDGDRLFTGCGLGLSKCSDTKPCPLHHYIVPIRKKLLAAFRDKTVQELVLDVNLTELHLS